MDSANVLKERSSNHLRKLVTVVPIIASNVNPVTSAPNAILPLFQMVSVVVLTALSALFSTRIDASLVD